MVAPTRAPACGCMDKHRLSLAEEELDGIPHASLKHLVPSRCLNGVLPIAAGRPVRRRLPGVLLEGPKKSSAVLGVRPLDVPDTEPRAGFLQQS